MRKNTAPPAYPSANHERGPRVGSETRRSSASSSGTSANHAITPGTPGTNAEPMSTPETIASTSSRRERGARRGRPAATAGSHAVLMREPGATRGSGSADLHFLPLLGAAVDRVHELHHRQDLGGEPHGVLPAPERIGEVADLRIH